MNSDGQRTRSARELAERSLVRLIQRAGSHANEVVVVGGLNPDFLAPNAPIAHNGTTDVDVLLELGVIYDRDELDFAWLESALDFADPLELGWRWVDRTSGFPVAIEILCDVDDNPGRSIQLPGARNVAAINLKGPRAALRAPVVRSLAVPDDMRKHPPTPETVEIRFASLGGYLCAKAAAVIGRNAAKDAYDFMYVVLYNDGGVRRAAQAIEEELVARPGPALRAEMLATLRRFADPKRAAARSFAEQVAIDSESFDRLVEDAISAAEAVARRLS